MTRDEWEERFSARIVDAGGFLKVQADEMARTAADENLASNGDEWLDPEDDADVELSYMAEDHVDE